MTVLTVMKILRLARPSKLHPSRTPDSEFHQSGNVLLKFPSLRYFLNQVKRTDCMVQTDKNVSMELNKCTSVFGADVSYQEHLQSRCWMQLWSLQAHLLSVHGKCGWWTKPKKTVSNWKRKQRRQATVNYYLHHCITAIVLTLLCFCKTSHSFFTKCPHYSYSQTNFLIASCLNLGVEDFYIFWIRSGYWRKKKNNKKKSGNRKGLSWKRRFKIG